MPLSALSESLSFHKSPEAFISSRLQSLATSSPETLPGNSSGHPIKASVLNRNVHIVSSHHQSLQVIGNSSSTYPPGDPSNRDADDRTEPSCPFEATPAYNELMAPFFPPPNLLLSDGQSHRAYKIKWAQQVQSLPEDLLPLLEPFSKNFLATKLATCAPIDIYDILKDLSWSLLFAVFLPRRQSQTEHQYEQLKAEVESLQETLLRGQFSTFPISIRTPLWSSARSRGVNARISLQKVLKAHFETLQREQQAEDNSRRDHAGTCPFLKQKAVEDADDIANHVLLFTSSLANKALASLLTSSILNVFLYRHPSDTQTRILNPEPLSLAPLLRSMPVDSTDRAKLLDSILLETERLSPPVVGVLRRATEDITVHERTPAGTTTNTGHTGTEPGGYHIPKDHEAWLYFPSISRDTTAYGTNASLFQFDRFMISPSSAHERSPQPSFAFGSGPKTCLGRDISRTMIKVVVEAMIDANIKLETQSELDAGVKAMLGWESVESAGGVEVVARDVKQLPCQRPRRAIMVTVGKYRRGTS